MEDLEDHDRERAVLVDPCRRSPSRRLWEQHTLRLETQLRESNVCRETANLVLRMVLAYGLGLFSWMVACSLIGRRTGSAQNVAGDSTA